MLKIQIPLFLSIVFNLNAANAEIDDPYELPMAFYIPPLETLNLPLKSGIPLKMKSGLDRDIAQSHPQIRSLEDINEETVTAFKKEMVQHVLQRTTFETSLLGEGNLRLLPPIWVFESTLLPEDAPYDLARKVARLAMSATNEYLHNVSDTQKRSLISDLYLRAGKIMTYAAENAQDKVNRQDHFLSAAQYFKWASVRIDDPQLKGKARGLMKEKAKLSIQSARTGS